MGKGGGQNTRDVRFVTATRVQHYRQVAAARNQFDEFLARSAGATAAIDTPAA
jgi:hypothetical protein